ncbi:hypothetical protein THIOKS11410014 [Thiocapsa sp. KS1]|nr:hypothetical protein THIOKS11410014 [Thiocapsa sp. KS1]
MVIVLFVVLEVRPGQSQAGTGSGVSRMRLRFKRIADPVKAYVRIGGEISVLIVWDIRRRA